MLISLIVAIISQRKHISKQQVVHLKYIQFLFVNYSSVKMGVGEPEGEPKYHPWFYVQI